MDHVTVLGSGGFIGSHLTQRCRDMGLSVDCPSRDDSWLGGDLGAVFYCVGLTADFRQRPMDTVEAHVCRLTELLRDGRFERLIYLSSTRVYGLGDEPADESTPLTVRADEPDHLYNLSKLMGESVALHSGRDVRVARLSNVYGPNDPSENFLTSIIRSAVIDGHIDMRTAGASSKDYISIDQTVELLIRLAGPAQHRVYNIASGRNTRHDQLTQRISALTGATVRYAENAPLVAMRPIDNQRTATEYNATYHNVLDDLQPLIDRFQTDKSS